MIKTSIYKNNGAYIGFESSGHAEYSGEYDIVCAGVSTLTQTLYFYLTKTCDLKDESLDVEQKDGYLKIIIKNYKYDINIQAGFEFMIRGLEVLEQEYSKHTKLEILEVQNDKI
ncbi:MAG: ribosomal-processing cysteine protease Prp [Peptoniphilaceae bacterium]